MASVSFVLNIPPLPDMTITIGADALPWWAEWVAIDGDGEVWAYEGEPDYSDDDDMWVCESFGRAEMLFKLRLPTGRLTVANWKSLAQRVQREGVQE